MKVRFADVFRAACYFLFLCLLAGCFCGQFFRGEEDVVAVSIAPTNSSILPGGTQQFTATGTFGGSTNSGTTNSGTTGGTGDVTANTRWTSSDTSIVTITSAGLATGVRAGTVTISGDCECYVSKTSLTVSAQAVTLASIVITPANPSVAVGQTQQFVATGHYTDGSTNVITSSVAWTSSSTTVATVNSSGAAIAVASGTSTITASSGNISASTVLTAT